MKRLYFLLLIIIISCSQNDIKEISYEYTKEKIDDSNSAITQRTSESEKSSVYMTTNITSKSLYDIYKSLNREAQGKTAIKLHMGEPGNKNFISPDLVKDLTLAVNGTFVDANTYYGGRRGNTRAHLLSAREHGFTYAPVDILDSEGEVSLPVNGGKRIQNAIVGSHYTNYDFIISVSHFKGHSMAGFGGTFKNIAVGMASVRGKEDIHRDNGRAWGARREVLLEKVSEYAKAIIDYGGRNMVYINLLSNLSVDCDCDGNAAHPLMKDIGILASLDPVALEKASLDLIYKAPRSESRHLIERIESRNGSYIIDYTESLGLGTKNYELISIDR